MARITGPLFSLAAAGTVGKTLQFRRSAEVQLVQLHPYQPPSASDLQVICRDRMRAARAAWLALSDGDRTLWHYIAHKRRLTDWVCFFAEYQYQNIQAPGAPLIPSDIYPL